MEPAQQAPPRAIGNYLVTILFVSIGIVDLIGRHYLDAGLWFALAMALAAFGNESRNWRAIPKARKAAGYLFLGAAVALFIARVAIDFSS